ncbi:hypothetical protein GWI72_09285 [Microvirga tunisiensis]|uniref:Tail protein n=1 Tax=Pannonibacter tanglangensis TaxID=2750084 RepID=A0A7X5F4S2_9HYPH|nr:glycoside hydrolase/phage tail family protein [Pannonibacter sp. XCT-53]NBN78459.1 hypothetical protein [Pannonibacter sp. XCT-53]
MATLILAAAGQALGGLVGAAGLGGILGKAAGAVAGNLLDQSLFGGGRTVDRGRLADLSVQASTEGAPIPFVYGRARLAGQVIWATRFEEVVSEESAGGKGGGPKLRNYSYFASFAVALCEGPIARVGRIWADGKLIDRSAITHRVYPGSPDQGVDPLIAAVQGAAPAYRDTAHVVFERLPLEPFGNRLPQLTFEVVRVVDWLERQIRAVTLIPGAGEFVYAPVPVTDTPRPGETRSVNRHTKLAATDWTAALDELQDLCPALESVALVVAWFGSDLRAGQCQIRPKVEGAGRQTSGMTWTVGPVTREDAEVVSQLEGRPAYGGTPCDASVLAAIRDLKARGLRVVLYPFILMDIPPDNSLPDPYGGARQAAFPWRGRIRPGAALATDVATFNGTAAPADFSRAGDVIGYAGPDEWSYRRFVLHHAHLAEAAGGVDAFLIGSEMRGLTLAHAGGGSYPFVTALKNIATAVRTVLRPQTRVSYAADWSEYGAHQPAAGELRFPLDPLWADPAISMVAIDNYMPLSDARGRETGDPLDVAALRGAIRGGEYFDWYYASDADRAAGVRSPITDGAYGKPFVFRAKDLKGWWETPHVERIGGVETGPATAWVPRSKPIWFTELGVPAIDKGANQPNVFVDPKSSESAPPYFSGGGRDDAVQRRALEASLSFWDDRHPDWPMGDNPLSPLYGGRMVDGANLHVWTWDARPFPAFPLYGEVWSDGGNWEVGHWLNGRLGGASLNAVIRAILADFGVPAGRVRVEGLAEVIDGLTLAGPLTAREAIEPLLEAFGGRALDRGSELVLTGAQTGAAFALSGEDLVESEPEAALLTRVRGQAGELPAEVRIAGEDIQRDHRRQIVASRRLEGGSRHVLTLDPGVAAPVALLERAAEARLHRSWAERERVEFLLPMSHVALEVGDVVELAATPDQSFSPPLKMTIAAIEDSLVRRIEAVRSEPAAALARAPTPRADPWRSTDPGPAQAVFLDLPLLEERGAAFAPHLAAQARPWPGSLAVLRQRPGGAGFAEIARIERPATIGRLVTPLEAGPLWRWDRQNRPELELFSGHLQSLSETAVLAGDNALALRSRTGGFELLQFRQADLVGERRYRLTGLLRGQKGTEAEALAGADAGADVVLMEASLVALPLEADQRGQALSYRLLPPGVALDSAARTDFTATGLGRAALPFAPVHLTARREAGGVRFGWIRRSRIGGDGWEAAEVPVGETREAYRLQLFSGAAVRHDVTVEAPGYLYPAAQELADFGALQTVFTTEVAQLSDLAGPGLPLKEILHV